MRYGYLTLGLIFLFGFFGIVFLDPFFRVNEYAESVGGIIHAWELNSVWIIKTFGFYLVTIVAINVLTIAFLNKDKMERSIANTICAGTWAGFLFTAFIDLPFLREVVIHSEFGGSLTLGLVVFLSTYGLSFFALMLEALIQSSISDRTTEAGEGNDKT
jgi:hypothetical protein